MFPETFPPLPSGSCLSLQPDIQFCASVAHTHAHTAHRSSSVRLWGILLFLGLWFQDCTSILLPHPSALPHLSSLSLSIYAISSTLLFPACLLSHLCPSTTISSLCSFLFPLSSLSIPVLVLSGLVSSLHSLFITVEERHKVLPTIDTPRGHATHTPTVALRQSYAKTRTHCLSR